MQKNPYSILGLPNFSGIPEIKKAYRKLAFRYHPDQNKTGEYAEERFREVKEAYDMLNDPIKKNQLDVSLRTKTLYAPSYDFAKYGMEPKSRNYKKPEENITYTEIKTDHSIWIKPIILIVISILILWIIMDPPDFLKTFMGYK